MSRKTFFIGCAVTILVASGVYATIVVPGIQQVQGTPNGYPMASVRSDGTDISSSALQTSGNALLSTIESNTAELNTQLPATLDGSGNLKTRALTSSDVVTCDLASGSSIVGKVGIDQTSDVTDHVTATGASGAALATSSQFSSLLTAVGSSVMQNSGGSLTCNAGTNLNTSSLATTTNISTLNTTMGSPMQNSGGSVTANAGTNLNTSLLATSAHQTDGSALSDGSNTAKVQPASTVPGATDKSLTISLSPNSSPLAVTGSFYQTTQPVSGTLTCNAGTNLNTSLIATAAKQPALGTAGSASADVITVQGVASMIAFKVDGSGVTQPVSASSLPLPTGAATSTHQTDGSSLSDGTNTTKVQAASTTPVAADKALTVSLSPNGASQPLPTGASTSANQSTANTSLASILTALGAAVMQSTGGTVALVAGSALIGKVTINDGTNSAKVEAGAAAAAADNALAIAISPNPSPECNLFIAINQTAGTTVITGTSSKFTYICSVVLVNDASGSAQKVSLIEGTGTVCASGTPIGLMGGITASMGFVAGGGVVSTSDRPHFKGRTAADNICVVQSGSTNISGWITYATAN